MYSFAYTATEKDVEVSTVNTHSQYAERKSVKWDDQLYFYIM